MSADVITGAEAVTRGWLTAVLARSEALERGSVQAFQILASHQRELSSNARIGVTYERGSSGELPRSLFLKTVDTLYDPDDPMRTSEVEYYSKDYVGVDGALVARCFDAARSESGRYHLLLEDLTETHAPMGRDSTNEAAWLGLADGLAAMHAHWWGGARLEQAGRPIDDARTIERFAAISERGVGYIVETCAADLGTHWLQTMYGTYDHHARRLIERRANPNGFTQIHGDVHPGNVLVPVSGTGRVYLVDRAPFEWSLSSWLGAYDLSHLMVTFLAPETRRKVEHLVLKHYHAGLISRGVTDYSWDQLYLDYRLTAPMSVYIATEWCRGSGRQSKHIWLPLLKNALTAVDDLNCSELWQR